MQASAKSVKAATREVLVFILGKEEYGVDILKVQEIRGYDKVTPIPSAPDFLKGVINLRGTIVPVIDMRVKFRLAQATYDELTVAIILRIGSRVIGIVVDGVSDVIDLTDEEVKPAPALGAVIDQTFLAGVATRQERMVLLLDIEKLLSSSDLNLLEQVSDLAAAGPP